MAPASPALLLETDDHVYAPQTSSNSHRSDNLHHQADDNADNGSQAEGTSGSDTGCAAVDTVLAVVGSAIAAALAGLELLADTHERRVVHHGVELGLLLGSLGLELLDLGGVALELVVQGSVVLGKSNKLAISTMWSACCSSN